MNNNNPPALFAIHCEYFIYIIVLHYVCKQNCTVHSLCHPFNPTALCFYSHCFPSIVPTDTFTDFFIDEKVDPPQDTVILMCKSASSLESKVTYNWTLNGKSVQAGLRFKINDSSLVVNVTETIRGFFSCVGSNPLIHTSSEYYFLERKCE